MQQGIRYFVKHSGEFLYKMSNEEDKINFKVSFDFNRLFEDNQDQSARAG